jgi:hypothetical protein
LEEFAEEGMMKFMGIRSHSRVTSQHNGSVNLFSTLAYYVGVAVPKQEGVPLHFLTKSFKY